MKRTDIDDTELVKLYNDNMSIPDMMAHFKTGHSVLYVHLKDAHGTVNRRSPSLWTPEEEAQLVAARAANATGQEYTDWIPTRSLDAIKGHTKQLRRLKRANPCE